MSDTCWLRINFARKDLDKFNEVLKDEIYNGEFWDEEDGDDEEIMATIYEANHGWCREIESLAKAGLTFTVEHSAGAEYGPCAYACYHGECIDVSTDNDGTPTVIAPKGCVDEKGLSQVKKYYEILDKIGGDTQ